MADISIAALFAVFIWWFSTGAILFVVKSVDRHGPLARYISVAAALPILAGGVYGYIQTLGMTSLAGVYLAFVSALAIWGWFELAFLAGVVTGPITRACPPALRAWERFIRAWGTIAYSEMALSGTLILLVFLGSNAENTFGMWTFIILFFARISAKLNLYFGVPNVNLEFLPRHMAHLASYFKIAPMNALFPFSVTALTLAIGCWLERAYSATAINADQIGFTLLTALTVLALIEHWIMVVAVGDAKLWRWLIKQPEGRQMPDPAGKRLRMWEDNHGL